MKYKLKSLKMGKSLRGHFEWKQKWAKLWKQPDVRDPSHQQRMRTVARGKIKMGFLWKSPNFKK